MGIVKRQWLEQEERGWSDPETWVCRRCIGDDPHLRYLVGQNLGSNACTYCGSSRRKAAPLAALMTAVLHGLRYSYNDEANAGCPYDKEFNIEFMSSSDVLQQMLESEGLEWPEKLLDDAAEALVNTGWVDAPDGDWMGAHTHERLHWSWGSFTSVVKYRSRFHFQRKSRSEEDDDELVNAHDMLPFLGRLVRQHRMVRRLPASTVLHRIRPGVHPHSRIELGAPPAKKAGSGRMNPAGIPYLYLAFDEKTALAETRVKSRAAVTVSTWSPHRDLNVIDLTHVPRCPSIFSEKRREYELVMFLFNFADEIAKPVVHDGSEHIEYVPTQVVSEYFSQSFRIAPRKRVDGLIYQSAVMPSGKNLVLFPQFDDVQCRATPDPFGAMLLNTARSGRVNRRGNGVI